MDGRASDFARDSTSEFRSETPVAPLQHRLRESALSQERGAVVSTRLSASVVHVIAIGRTWAGIESRAERIQQINCEFILFDYDISSISIRGSRLSFSSWILLIFSTEENSILAVSRSIRRRRRVLQIRKWLENPARARAHEMQQTTEDPRHKEEKGGERERETGETKRAPGRKRDQRDEKRRRAKPGKRKRKEEEDGGRGKGVGKRHISDNKDPKSES